MCLSYILNQPNFINGKVPIKKSYLIRLTINTSMFFTKNYFFALFSRLKLFFFSFLHTTTKFNLKWTTTLQQPWTNCLAPLMWTLAGVKGDLVEIFGPKMTPTLDVKPKVFNRENKNAEFRLRQNFTMGEADFNQFIWQRNQLVVAADKFLTEQNLSPDLQSTLSKDMEKQLKLVHKLIDVADHPNRRIFVILLRCRVDNPENSYTQASLFGRKKEEETFQKIVLKTKLGLHRVEPRSKRKLSPKKKLNNCQILKRLIEKMKFLV